MAAGLNGLIGQLVTNHVTLAFTEDGDTATIPLLYMVVVFARDYPKKNSYAIHMDVQVLLNIVISTLSCHHLLWKFALKIIFEKTCQP